MIKEQLFQSGLKVLGLLPLNEESLHRINGEAYKEYVRILLVTKGCKLRVDLIEYSVKQPSLFFVGANQYLHLTDSGGGGYFMFYNRDFYCIQIHDNEVACDGLLFHNIHNMPMIKLNKDDIPPFTYIFDQMEYEFARQDTSVEEMIRTYMKQLFIRSSRLWRRQNLPKELAQQNTDLEFFRKFTLLVEDHYKQKHNVANYAELLFVAPKTITHKFKKLKLPQPNDVIKNRIVLEAKRLLVHTDLTAKEIGYQLGYDDPAYFSRLFVQKTGETPSVFRTKFLAQN